MIRLSPLARLISRHGSDILLNPTPSPDQAMPWQPDQDIPTEISVRGIVQRVRPTPDPDLPQGSIRAIAVMVLPKDITKPQPGDHMTALDRHWRIETILPVARHRRGEVVEAVVVSPGAIS